jgi:hypothetical protein
MLILNPWKASPEILKSKSIKGHAPLTLIVAPDVAHALKTALLFSKLPFNFNILAVVLLMGSYGIGYSILLRIFFKNFFGR